MTSDHERFARKYAHALRKAGVADAWDYDAEGFALRTGSHVVNLSNAHADWKKAPWWRRGRVLRAYASAMAVPHDLPQQYDLARSNLMPRLRGAAALALLKRQLPADLDGIFSHQPLNDELAVELVYDTPAATMSVSASTLAQWSTTLDNALHMARLNLRRRTAGTFAAIAPGVYAAQWNDSHDAARLLLTELVARLDVVGDPVALVPDREHLFITGSEDPEGLRHIAGLAHALLQEPRRITGQSFVYRGGTWSPWSPATDHPQRFAYHQLARLGRALDYGEQKEMLDAEHQRTGTDVYVAGVLLLTNRDGTECLTATTWAKDVVALLPRTDTIAFGPLADGKCLDVPWSRVEAVLGATLSPQGLVPERYRVERFPTTEELARLTER